MDETISALFFAQRAKTVKNKVHVNIKRSNEELEKVIERLLEEQKALRNELQKYKKGGVLNKKASKKQVNKHLLYSDNSKVGIETSFDTETKSK